MKRNADIGLFYESVNSCIEDILEVCKGDRPPSATNEKMTASVDDSHENRLS